MMGYGWGPHSMGLLWLVPVGLICLAVYLTLSLVNGRRRSCCSDSHEYQSADNRRALEILAERYAKGEINDEEYRQKKPS